MSDMKETFTQQKIEAMFVTLPLSDGSELECKIFAAFDLADKYYVALMPIIDDKGTTDPNGQLMLYRMEDDPEGNPIVLEIETDSEYEAVANRFCDLYL